MSSNAVLDLMIIEHAALVELHDSIAHESTKELLLQAIRTHSERIDELTIETPVSPFDDPDFDLVRYMRGD